MGAVYGEFSIYSLLLMGSGVVMYQPNHDVSQPRDEILLVDEFHNIGVECRKFFENRPCNPSGRRGGRKLYFWFYTELRMKVWRIESFKIKAWGTAILQFGAALIPVGGGT